MEQPVYNNYLCSENPWNLPAPPAWWLAMLGDYDRELVVFPSRHRQVYVLARRRHFSNAMAEMDTLDKNLLKQSAGLDGDLMAKHNLIYVRHLIGNTIQRANIFQWLRDHDLQAHGGGAEVAKLIETEEEYNARKKRAQTIENIDYRARDAWRSYQARTGRRSGYRGNKPSALQMPVKSFDSRHESAVAAFVRD